MPMASWSGGFSSFAIDNCGHFSDDAAGCDSTGGCFWMPTAQRCECKQSEPWPWSEDSQMRPFFAIVICPNANGDKSYCDNFGAICKWDDDSKLCHCK